MENNNLSRRVMLAGSISTAAAMAIATAATTTAQGQTAVPAEQPISGSSKLHQILSRGHVIVGTGSDIPPYYFTDETGKLIGFEIELAGLLAKGLFNDPSKVEFVIQNADARIPNLLSDRVDVTLQNLTVTSARAQQASFTVPYYRAGQGFLMLAGSRYTDFAAMKAAGSDIVISALQNVTAEDWIHQALPEATVELFASPDAALQAVNARRADAQMITYGRIRWAVSQYPERYRDSGYSYRPNSIAMAVKPGDAIWLNWLNTTIREWFAGVDSEEFAAIYKRWTGEELPAPKIGYPRELLS